MRALVRRLAPVIERRVASTLWQRSVRGDIRQEIRDKTQDVFLSLLDSGGKALLAWDPARGTSLEGFVSLLAHRQVISLLRNGSVTPWREEFAELHTIEASAAGAPTAEQVVGSREHLRLLLDAVRERLSPLGLEIFQRLIVDETPIDELSVKLGMTMQALYQWRSRLLKLARQLTAEILIQPLSEPEGDPRSVEGSHRR